jgi:DNA-binding transcriptional ArsR family regulator
MVRDVREDGDVDPEAVFNVLADEDCRAIVRTLAEPMTAEEISAATDIPKSTTYRKLELLTDAGLLAEGIEIRSDGQHASQYVVGFEEVRIALGEDRSFDVDIAGTPQTPEGRLAALWSEVQKETQS